MLSSGRWIVAMLTSAMMAWPAPLWATSPRASVAVPATDGGALPVSVVSVPMPDGQVATGIFGLVPAAQEAAIADSIVRQNPDRTYLEVSGAQDPVLRAAAGTGLLPRVKTFIVSRFEQSPWVRLGGLPASAKASLVHEFAQLRSVLATWPGRFALVGAFFTGGSYAGITFLGSSRIDAAVAVGSVYLMWAGFQTLHEHHWQRLLRAGGDAMVEVCRLFGSELTEAQARLMMTAGSFGIVVAANSLLASWALGWAGHLESVVQAVGIGLVGANDIFDKIFGNRYARGLLSENWRVGAVLGRILIGTTLEVATLQNIPDIQAAVTVLNFSAFTWLVMGSDFEDHVLGAIRMVTLPAARLGRSIAGGLFESARNCRVALQGVRSKRLRFKPGRRSK